MSYDEKEFFNTRKDARKQRKELRQKDRSQFKKTDQAKESEEELPDLPKGRVIAIRSETLDVDMGKGRVLLCTLKGSLKQDKGRIKNLVTVGDYVLVEGSHIAHVLPRTSILSRVDPKHHRKEQLIAANIDQVFITLSAASPPLKPHLADRYIIAARQGNMVPILVINKIDLQRQDEFIELYRKLGYNVIPVSAMTGEGLNALEQELIGRTSVFSGQSGTGKSSLINALFKTQLKTGNIVAWNEKGSHTTTHATLVPIAGGGFCLDTPGIRSMGIKELDRNDLILHFPEIAALSCRYADCSHRGEEGCLMEKALDEGLVHPMRYDSYCKLLDSISEVHRRR